jgi:hypothetical protein
MARTVQATQRLRLTAVTAAVLAALLAALTAQTSSVAAPAASSGQPTVSVFASGLNAPAWAQVRARRQPVCR